MSSNSTFANCSEKVSLDPTKHVNFVHGMVLGVQDFQQEFAWHAGRHATLARELAGYGTVSGLRVAVDDNGTLTPKIAVDPGVAVTPTGAIARVTARQCATLVDWLQREPGSLEGRTPHADSAGRQTVSVYVRLRYTDCLADPVPIPGEPCRTEDEAMAPSRVADSWRLHLSFDSPPQEEEDAVRALVHWLKKIKLVEHAAATPAALVEALRVAAAATLESEVEPEELVLTDPPESLLISRDDLCECLRAALLVWVTELRPKVRTKVEQPPCCGQTAQSLPRDAEERDDVLLAELLIPVRERQAGGDEFEFDPTVEIVLREGRRPYLLHTRMLQELVNCGPDRTGELTSVTFGSLQAISEELLLLWVHHPLGLDLSAPGAVALAINDAAVADFSVVGLGAAPNVFELRLGGSLPVALREGDRVSVGFDLSLVTEVPSGRTLFDALEPWTRGYLDRQGNSIFVRCIVAKLRLDDLVDVDASEASDDLVLTARGGRWQPAAVPRRLDDLGDVDVDGLSVSNGQVLTHEDGRWQPRDTALPAHQHALSALSDVDIDELTVSNGQVLTHENGRWQPRDVGLPALSQLSDVNVPAPANGEVLTFQTNEWVSEPVPRTLNDLEDVDTVGGNEGDSLTLVGGTWRPGRPEVEAEAAAVSGLVKFTNFKRDQVLLFGAFRHGLKQPVMVRLAFEFLARIPVRFEEDTATVSVASFPRLVVYAFRNSDEFLILVDDANAQGDPLDFGVRWFAVPAKDAGEIDAMRFDGEVLLATPEGRERVREVLLAEVAAGARSVPALRDRLGASADRLRPILDSLVADNLLSIANDTITLNRPR